METNSPQMTFKDRSTGLTVFGILTLLGGGLWGLIGMLSLIARTVSAARPTSQLTQAMLLPLLIQQGLIAVTLIWLGIGSIQARRWARALLVVLSWSALVCGVIALGFMALLAPHFFEIMKSTQRAGQPEVSHSIQVGVLIFTGLIMISLYIVIPTVWGLFYSSKHVKATVEARDPVTRWTDRCPLPVLAVSLWLVFAAIMKFVLPVAYHGVFPFFGILLSGAAGGVACIALAAIWIYCAYAIYKLDSRGWWIIVAGLCLVSISNAITYSHHDINQVYQQMGFSAEQIALVQKFNFFGGHTMAWSSLIYTVPVLGYLFYIRKFFRRSAAEAVATSSPS
jgi:hypothetical protein